MKQFKISGNFFKITDTDTGVQEYKDAASNTVNRILDGDISFYSKSTGLKRSVEKYNIDNIVNGNDSDSPFASIDDVETYLDDNTGFSLAGSTAQTTKTYIDRVKADGGTIIGSTADILVPLKKTALMKPKLVLLPNGIKAGKVYAQLPENGSGDFVVDRNSKATMIKDGLIVTVDKNIPRINDDGSILVEGQSTNYYKNSEDILSAGASGLRGTISSNTIINPRGEVGAYTFNDSVDNNSHMLYAGTLYMPIGSMVFSSVIVKKKDLDFIVLRVYDGADDLASRNSYLACFNLDLGVFVRAETIYGIVQDGFYSIELIGDGWYRCTVGLKKTTIVKRVDFIIYSFNRDTTIGNSIYTGTGNTGFYIWSVEVANSFSSYNPTNGTAVTRLADVIKTTPPIGTTQIIETINGIEQAPITTIPVKYIMPVGRINKIRML